MDVILLKDVEKLGAEGAVVRVKPGFARNYLMPCDLAVPATAQQLASIETLARQRRAKSQRLQADAEGLKRTLEGRALTLTLTVGAEDKAFGSVTAHDVVEALAKGGITLEKHVVQLAEPIKTLGTFEVPIRLHPAVTATLKLSVVKA